jgi:hypothetical protein
LVEVVLRRIAVRAVHHDGCLHIGVFGSHGAECFLDVVRAVALIEQTVLECELNTSERFKSGPGTLPTRHIAKDQHHSS